jgi:hypothetical protein
MTIKIIFIIFSFCIRKIAIPIMTKLLHDGGYDVTITIMMTTVLLPEMENVLHVITCVKVTNESSPKYPNGQSHAAHEMEERVMDSLSGI